MALVNVNICIFIDSFGLMHRFLFARCLARFLLWIRSLRHSFFGVHDFSGKRPSHKICLGRLVFIEQVYVFSLLPGSSGHLFFIVSIP
jgi:hypothetical protein